MAKKKEEKESRKKQQWTTATLAPVEDNSTKSSDSAKEISEKEKLDPIRPAFAMQMGLKGLKGKTPEPQASKKKPMPFVGKMPRKRDITKLATPPPTTENRDSSSPAKSKFGPPSGTNVPPPGVVTTQANPTTPAPIPPKPLQPPTPPTTFTMAPRYQPPPPVSVSAQFGGIRAPKNPTPKSVDMKDMLAAAKAHMSARGEGFQERAVAKMALEIPLPPLPAAQDRDPDAMKDTRPPKLATPPPTTEKTELEFMLEKHANNIPPG